METTGVPRRTGLVDLLGEPRATIVRTLKREGERSAPELAEELGITDVAVRRHLAVLAEEGFISDRIVKQERGRPVARYRLTDHGEDLFPHRYDEMVDELIAFLVDRHGRDGMRAFLRWRQERETQAYAAAIDGDDVAVRLEQLAEALSDAGFLAEVRETPEGFELTQTHCAVFDVAKEHPEMCAHEAAMFRRVLVDVRISRR
jgi:predicted ArsR family transcriptional regulator